MYRKKIKKKSNIFKKLTSFSIFSSKITTFSAPFLKFNHKRSDTKPLKLHALNLPDSRPYIIEAVSI